MYQTFSRSIIRSSSSSRVQIISCSNKNWSDCKRRFVATNCLTYFLCKLIKTCLVILLLLPFLLLLTCTPIQNTNGQEVVFPLLLKPMLNSNLEENNNDINNIVPWFDDKIQAEPDIVNSTTHSINNHNKSLFYEYSLIILSQSAKNIYIGLPEKEKNQIIDTKAMETSRILHAPKSNDSILRRIRRTININSTSNAGSQILKNIIEKNKPYHHHHKYNQIINKETLTKLVLNGLGLKKLPDIKKANISQYEYSSKYLQYLERLQNNNPVGSKTSETLKILSIATNSFSDISQKELRQKREMRQSKIQEGKSFKQTNKKYDRSSVSDKTNILLYFPLHVIGDGYNYEKVDEANVRLMLLYNPALAPTHRSPKTKGSNLRHRKQRLNKNGSNENQVKNITKCTKMYAIGGTSYSQAHTRNNIIVLKVFQLLPRHKRYQLDSRRIEFEHRNYEEDTHSQWLEFDVTEGVRAWLNKSHENLGLEIQCDKCKRIGARILSEISTSAQQQHQKSNNDEDQNDDMHNQFHLTPVLNIIGHVGPTRRKNDEVHSTLKLFNNQSVNYFSHRLNQANSYTKDFPKWPNSCYKERQRCCRHKLDVAFKEIKGFEFIIQPKTFDAGYCRGRCPPRHNPAHHHALLQSLMWQQDHSRAPRPCCAPSKLTKLEILHVDEDHSDKLKISTWSDMQVVECACS